VDRNLWSYRGHLSVQEPAGERWHLALDRLREGHVIVFADVALSVGADVLRAEVGSRWLRPTERGAREEMARAERVVGALIKESEDFADLVGQRAIVFALLSDYGTGAVLLAEIRNGQFRWARGVEPPVDER
jgi:hypothetical protein